MKNKALTNFIWFVIEVFLVGISAIRVTYQLTAGEQVSPITWVAIGFCGMCMIGYGIATAESIKSLKEE